MHVIFFYISVAVGGKWGTIGFWDVSDNTSQMHGVQVIKVSKIFEHLNVGTYILLGMLIFHFSLTQDQSTALRSTNLINVDWFQRVMTVPYDCLSKLTYEIQII